MCPVLPVGTHLHAVAGPLHLEERVLRGHLLSDRVWPWASSNQGGPSRALGHAALGLTVWPHDAPFGQGRFPSAPVYTFLRKQCRCVL